MKGKILSAVIFAFLCLFSSGQINAQLNVDATYNAGVTEGKVDARVSAVQADGKILVGGGFSFVNGVEKNTLARLNADGTLDTTFNPGGAGPNALVYEIKILSDGKILIGGTFATYNGVAKAGIARLNADGTLDTTFNTAGNGLTGTAQTIAIQADGKILLSGSGVSAYNGVQRFSVLRLNADGTLDTTFTSPFTTAQFVEEVDVQTDGKVMIGGSFNIGTPARTGVARLNADGTLDTTFNASGGGVDGGVVAMTIRSDGKILIGGQFATYNGTARNSNALLNTDGSLDTTFASITALTVISIEYFAFTTDGKIYAAGLFSNTLASIGLIRLNANGSLDSTIPIASVDNLGYHVTLQADGKPLMSGFFYRVASQSRTPIVRFNTDGFPDTTFNPSLTGFGYAAAIARQADGKTVAAGNFNFANGTARNNVARFNADGTLDATFTVGTGTSADSNASNIVNALAVQPDGKILVGGIFSTYNGTTRRAIFRLNTDGSLDTSFFASFLTTYTVAFLNDILLLPNGKILIGGSFLEATTRNLIMLNPDGTQDTSFPSSVSGAVTKMLLQPDGKILVSGSFTTSGGQSRNRITRLNADGTLDTSFNPGTGANSTVSNLVLQPDNKIIAVGLFTTFNGNSRTGIVRLNSDGTVDNTFGGTGTNATVEAAAVQSDGKIYIVGRFTTYNGVVRNRFARLNADGSLDTAFASGFDADPRFFARRILVQPDGKLMVSGLFKSYAGAAHNALVRINPTPSPTLGNGQIVFVSNRDGNQEIYKMNADGSNVTRLTNNTFAESDPQWSPDGTKIAFASARDGNSEIYVMNADGSNQTRVTNNTVFDTEPTWSPDSTKLAFQSLRSGNRDIYAVNADGSNELRLTTSTGQDILPKWSPNGAQIVFISNRDGNYEVYTMSANGDAQTRLTTNTASEFSPDWSPDGSQILFSSDRDGNGEIYVMSANGANQTRLTNSSSNEDAPVWSPDGTKIVFISDRDGNFEVYTMNANGNGEVRLTNSASSDGPADWQPLTAPQRTAFDYDGDGKADVSVFRNSAGAWYLNRSTAGFAAVNFGQSGDRIVPADYDGDGKTDVAVFRNGNWYYLRSSDGAFAAVAFGQAGDVPVAADFDGDGKADQAVFRGGNWYINRSAQGFTAVAFGISTDKPVAADYDGDGKADVAVFRDGNWYSLRSSDGNFSAVAFGQAGDIPVPADYDGDGKADQAVYRGGNWYLNRSTAGFGAVAFGISTDVPVAADYDGDGKADQAVFRDGNWYILQSTAGFTAQAFGTTGDKPTPSAFLP
ncbi:MAG TPA: LpqB family beta-propeller domain-containing protein [Pyrinomonadaceae bacterium]|nr:LpqB family beta-propeller domain-containing protein [Pyrinomonadaceae bacterium]